LLKILEAVALVWTTTILFKQLLENWILQEQFLEKGIFKEQSAIHEATVLSLRNTMF